MTIRSLLHRILPALALSLASTTMFTTAAAQAESAEMYPSKPIRMISPFAAGGTTDILARIVAKELLAAQGQPIVVENQSGAGGTIGAAIVARSAADGYTLEVGGVSTHAMAGSLYKKLPFDPVESFDPVSILAYATIAIAVPASAPYNDLKELIAYAKAHPGELTYSSAGVGSINHLAMASLAKTADIDLLHVPYRGGAPAVTALLQQEVQVVAAGTSLLLPHVQSGKVRLIAITDENRARILPEVPTAGETLKGFKVANWYGLLGPKGLPAAVSEKLWNDIDRIMKQPDIMAQLDKMGLEYPGISSERFNASLKEDRQYWDQLIKELQIQPN
ncbi:MAG TPA: tripartite tricarboxylate transporter substrate binding protein [Eoetvoesiella sp.]